MHGDVTDWVAVAGNAADYYDDNPDAERRGSS